MKFRSFALTIYGGEGVADVCLLLQDDYGCDISLLLFCLWVGDANGQRMAPRDMAAADALVRDWRGRVVRPLRALRRDWKSGVEGPDSHCLEELRKQVKSIELRSEEIQIDELEAWWLGRGAKPNIGRAGRRNMVEYLTFLERPADSQLSERLSALSEASRNALN